MLLAKRRISRFNHVTSYGGYSNPAPGPLILSVYFISVKNYLVLKKKLEMCSCKLRGERNLMFNSGESRAR